MKKVIFIFVLLANLCFLSAMSYPHGFHGEIIVKDGSNSDGLTLIGKINDIATGSCIISDGKYDLVIIDNIGNGGEIEFYIGEEKAKETSEFITFEVTELDLTFDTIPLDLGDCGNGICDEGECSSCPIDCGISECLGNGVCDLEMGEDCAIAPQDCACDSGYSCVKGVCQINKDNNDGGNNGGGDSPRGGGGGSSSSSTTNTQITNDTINLNFEIGENDNILGIDELNEANEQRETISPGITGSVIGFAKTGKGIGLIFAFLIIVFGIGVITFRNKLKKEE